MQRITLRQFEEELDHYLQNAHKAGGYIIEDPDNGDLVLIPKSMYDALVNQLALSTDVLKLQQDIKALQNSMITKQEVDKTNAS